MHRSTRVRRRSSHHVLTIPALAACMACALPALAADVREAARHVVEQPSQAMAETLRAIARQTGASVLFDAVAVRGLVAPRVSGRLSAAEAISQALEGSGLMVEVMGDGAVVVKPAVAPAAPAAGTKTSLRQVQLVARTVTPDQDRPGASGSGQPSAGSASQKVEVTGTRLRLVESEGAVPVRVFRREDIERSGQATLERFLGSLNEASVSPGEGAFGATAGQGSVQLRGLPLGSTLILVNGRRVQAVGSSSANFFNLNLIPMAAVERVEIVPVGSSAVYGGDALAGVVNVILRQSMDGVALDMRLASASGTGDGSVSLAAGTRSPTGGFTVVGTYSRSTPLTMAERSFFDDADYRPLGGPDARSRNCVPGTVTTADGSNLPGLTAPVAGIPLRSPGTTLVPADFAATAGQPNLCNSLASGRGSALVHGSEALGLHAVGDLRLSDRWSLFSELTLADDRLRAEQGGLVLSNVLVPETNPYNPFGVPVRVSARLGDANGTQFFARTTRFTRVLAGLRGELPAGWDLELTASTSRDAGERVLGNGNTSVAARNAALASASLATALNPFTVGPAASQDVLDAIWTDSVRANRGRKDLVTVLARGSLGALPAGEVEAVAGAELARDRYETSIPGDVSVVDSRRARAIFGELRLPLMRAGEGTDRGRELAALTVAARGDRYSDFGSASTYQSGLEWRPSRSTLLRASAATSFKPPTLLQTSVDEIRLTTDDFGLVDPALGGAPIVGGEVLRTTNAALEPEEGRAVSLGAIWEPVSQPGMRFGATAWRVRIDGLIALLWPQVTLDNEAQFPGLVTRAADGSVSRVLYTEVNFGRVETAGLDLEAAYGWQAHGGRWNVGASATRTSRYDVVIAPGAPMVSRLGKRFADYWAPEWKGRLSAGFDAGAWRLGWTGRYVGAYEDAGTSTRRLGGFWLHDLAGGFDLRKLGFDIGAAKSATVSLAIVNLTDRLPEFANSSPYYDVTQADWRGRYASVRFSVDW
ncbi:TonB-dependent receptor [Rubrivivax albus]|nr:TonB-dependent receptor [Rubrivivax albus]